MQVPGAGRVAFIDSPVLINTHYTFTVNLIDNHVTVKLSYLPLTYCDHLRLRKKSFPTIPHKYGVCVQLALAQRSKRIASAGACSMAIAVTFATSAPE